MCTDAVRENVPVDATDPTRIAPIDVATALGRNVDEPDCPVLPDALLPGRREVRERDTAPPGQFVAVRAATHVGWTVDRQHEEGGRARADRAQAPARRPAPTRVGRAR